MKDLDFTLDYIGGNCPVQAEGKIGGKPFYFRARWDKWSIGIGGDDPVLKPEWYHEAPYGNKPGDAGWMPVCIAMCFISSAFLDYCHSLND